MINYINMILKSDVKKMDNAELVNCPECGCECWKTETAKILEAENESFVCVCGPCAIEMGTKNVEREKVIV